MRAVDKSQPGPPSVRIVERMAHLGAQLFTLALELSPELILLLVALALGALP